LGKVWQLDNYLMENQLRGEYWIQHGSVDFADGDVGERNHEGIAIDSVCSEHVDSIISLAKELGLECDLPRYEVDPEAIARVMTEIAYEICETKAVSALDADKEIAEFLGCKLEAVAILHGGGDARLYVMKYEDWIAIRGHNIELYGYSEEKRKYLAHGLSEILESEGIEDDVDPEEIDFYLDDLKTKRSSRLTLADIESPVVVNRPNMMPQTVKKASPMTNAGSEENKGQNPQGVKNKWTKAAQDAKVIGAGQDLWRGTSEWVTFSEWFEWRMKCDTKR
jgi:hypothetical protein